MLMRRQRENSQEFRCSQRGFSLVELMIVVAIMAILASVAIPAYVNYVNRSKQNNGLVALMTAKMEQEMYWSDNNRYTYAGTIGCLPSFSSNAACLANCSGCAQVSYLTGPGGYTISVQAASTNDFTILAQKKIYTFAATDIMRISAGSQTPTVVNVDALKFSLFQWMFQ